MSGFIGNFARAFFGANEAAQLLTLSTVLSDSQVKNLPITPVTIAPAPGAGLILIPTLTLLFFKNGSSAYTNIDPNCYIITQWHGSGGLSSILGNSARLNGSMTQVSDFLGSTGGQFYPLTYPFQDDRGAPESWGMMSYASPSNANANLAFELTANNGSVGAFTGGGSTDPLTVVTTYMIVSVP